MIETLEKTLSDLILDYEVDYRDLESFRILSHYETEDSIEEDCDWDRMEELDLKREEFLDNLTSSGWVEFLRPSEKWVNACETNPKLKKRVQNYLEMKVENVEL